MYDNELYELLNKYNVTNNNDILHKINNYNKQINYNGFIKSIIYVKPSIELIKNNIINYVYSIIDIVIKYDYSNTIKIAEFGLLIDKSFNDWLFENSNDNDKLKYGLTLLENDISYDIYQKIKHLISKQQIINLIDTYKKNDTNINIDIINILFDIKEYHKILNIIEQYNYPTDELYHITNQLIQNNFIYKTMPKYLKKIIENPLLKKKSSDYYLSINFLKLYKIYINNIDSFNIYLKYLTSTYCNLIKFQKLLNDL